jgi:hypothetical protein
MAALAAQAPAQQECTGQQTAVPATDAQAHLNTIQSNILGCLDVAADVLDVLAAADGDSGNTVPGMCHDFLTRISESQV